MSSKDLIHINQIFPFRTSTLLFVQQQTLLNQFWNLTVKVTVGKPQKGRLTSKPNARTLDPSLSFSAQSSTQETLTLQTTSSTMDESRQIPQWKSDCQAKKISKDIYVNRICVPASLKLLLKSPCKLCSPLVNGRLSVYITILNWYQRS